MIRAEHDPSLGFSVCAEDRVGTLRRLLESYARHVPVERIAVVGNAPTAPDASRAQRIDASDLVVRMTAIRLDDDGAANVGNRTDVVLVHRGTVATPWTFAGHPSRLFLLPEPGRRHWEPATMPHWWPEDLGVVHLPNDLFSEPLVDRLGLERSEATWATTGTLGVWTMLTLFPQAVVTVAGFSIIENPDQILLEHAAGGSVPLTAEHRLHEEARLLRQLAGEGRVVVLP